MLLLTQLCGASPQWYRGNTHVHTELCGHADSSPEFVTKWYHDHGYNFLILSEHNKFIDPETVKLPDDLRDDFILIPGQEVTNKIGVHTTAMNTDRLVSWLDEGVEPKSRILSNQVDRMAQAGGTPILNHPHGGSQLKAHDIRPVEDLHMMEIYNANTKRNNLFKRRYLNAPLTGDALWDELLTDGMFIYGVGSDDAHVLQKLGPNESNAGLGWVMVRADELNPDSIVQAMRQGDFYASNGVYLKAYERNRKRYLVEVDEAKTQEALAGLPSWSGLESAEGVEGYRIEFIGSGGRVLKATSGTEASFTLKRSEAYARVRVVFTRKRQERGFERFYAWGQPIFSDERSNR